MAKRRTRRKPALFKKLGLRDVTVFKLANRKGFAAIARNHLTEGRSIPQVYARLVKTCRSRGFELPADKLPKLTARV